MPRLRGQLTTVLRLARGVASLALLIRREQIDVVCANTVRASCYAAPAAQLTRTPLVWYLHDLLPAGLYTRLMCAVSSGIIAVSRAASSSLPCAARGRVIANGVKLNDFVPAAPERAPQSRALRARWGIPDEAVLVGQVARLQHWKGQRDFIAAAEQVLRHRSDVYFAIVGGDIFNDAGDYERDLRKLVRERGLEGRVVLTGHQVDLPSTFQALDIAVQASTREPFGRTLIEAGASALPVVAYADGGAPEIVIDERTGLLVPAGDPGSLAATIERLAADPTLRLRLGRNGREHIAANFEARQLTQMVEEALVGAPRRTS
jgi:glycosyltransferase involved in cell wall biosynthesis